MNGFFEWMNLYDLPIKKFGWDWMYVEWLGELGNVKPIEIRNPYCNDWSVIVVKWMRKLMKVLYWLGWELRECRVQIHWRLRKKRLEI